MSLRFHRIPRSMFEALASGGGGSETIHLLASAQYSKHLLLLRGVVERAMATGHHQASAAQVGYDLLADVQRFDPLAVQAVVSYPSVGAWAARTMRALRGEPEMAGAEPAGLSAVAAAAAIRGRMPSKIAVPVIDGLVMLPSLGAAVVASRHASVRSRSDGTEVITDDQWTKVPDEPHRDAPGWLAVRRVCSGSLDVPIDDMDPFRLPAEPTVAHRLDDADFEAWTRILTDTWPFMAHCHPEIAAELVTAIRAIVPLTLPPQGQVSTSSAETFGAVALSRPPDVRTLAVTLVHEVQHIKLSALLDMVTLIRSDDGRRFYAPWRDDPRPARGLLQGAYAYVGVTRFWHRQRQLDDGEPGLRAHAEFARWRAAAMRVVGTLQASGLLTPEGTEFVEGMAQVLREWHEQPVPGDAQALADSEAEKHLTRWRSANGQLPAQSTQGL